MTSRSNLQIEQRVVRHLIRELKKAGYRPEWVWDGGDYVSTLTEAQVLEAVFSVDTSTIHFDFGKGKNGKSHGVYIVCGNGWDCLSDWHVGDDDFARAMETVCAWIDTREAA